MSNTGRSVCLVRSIGIDWAELVEVVRQPFLISRGWAGIAGRITSDVNKPLILPVWDAGRVTTTSPRVKSGEVK